MGIMRTAKYNNALAQKKWRDKRNALARTLRGEPPQIADNMVRLFGAERAKVIAQAMIERVDRREAR
jgi:hypothetical protein